MAIKPTKANRQAGDKLARIAEKMERLFADRLFHPIIVLIIALSVLAAYSNSLDTQFQFDDLYNISENPIIKDTGNIPILLKSQRGLTRASFALNYAIGGMNVFGYHVVNLAIHAINGALAYIFILLILRLCAVEEVRARMTAAFIALLFVLHPIQTQGVTYIVQRMESMASMFYILAFILFIKAAGTERRMLRGVLYCLVGVSYIFGFYSKEIAYTLPSLILIFDLLFVSEGSVKKLSRRWPLYVILSALFVFFTVKTIIPIGGFGDLSKESSLVATAEKAVTPKVPVIPGTDIPISSDVTAGFSMSLYTPREYLFTQFNVMVYYLAILLVPVNQNLDYDFPISYSFFTTPEVREGTVLNIPIPPPAVSFTVLLLIALSGVVLAIRSFKGGGVSGRVAAFFIFWYFIILAPTSSILPIADVIFEHRLYLPSLGFFVIFVISADILISKLFCEKTFKKQDVEIPRIE